MQVPYAPNQTEWQRRVSQLLNRILSGYVYPEFDTAPTGVNQGFTYFDTVTKKVRTFDGTIYRDHW